MSVGPPFVTSKETRDSELVNTDNNDSVPIKLTSINIDKTEGDLKEKEKEFQQNDEVLRLSLTEQNKSSQHLKFSKEVIGKNTDIKTNNAAFVRQIETLQSPSDVENAENNTNFVRLIPRLPTIGPLSFCFITDLDEFLAKSKIDFEKSFREKSFSELKITDFNVIKNVGKGTYGKVILAQLKKDETFYAVKLIEKKEVVKNNFVRYVMTEKRVLQSVNFPFLVHLKHFFADFKYMYFAMPFIPGGDFCHYLHKHKPLKESHAKFYIGQLILALEYLHYMGIIHRDVKPENIIIDLFGYLKLGDFGQCIKWRTNDKAWTFVGTPEYMAPEVIVGKGYDCAVDWWSLGVVTFEVCAGRLPFLSEKVNNLYKLILTVKYNCPDCFSRQLKTLVRSLLVNNPSERIANRKSSAYKIKAMAWLKNTDWLALLNRRIEAPYLPDTSKALSPGHSKERVKSDQ